MTTEEKDKTMKERALDSMKTDYTTYGVIGRGLVFAVLALVEVLEKIYNKMK